MEKKSIPPNVERSSRCAQRRGCEVQRHLPAIVLCCALVLESVLSSKCCASDERHVRGIA